MWGACKLLEGRPMRLPNSGSSRLIYMGGHDEVEAGGRKGGALAQQLMLLSMKRVHDTQSMVTPGLTEL